MAGQVTNIRHGVRNPRKRLSVAIAGWAALLVCCVVTSGAIAVTEYTNRIAETINKTKKVIPSEYFPQSGPDDQNPADLEGAQTILLLGSDSRGSVDDARSDTMMIMRVPKDRKGVYIVSFLRDSWVYMDGYGYAKINASFSYGGLPLAVDTVESYLSTKIDHVMMIDFAGFKDVTDALGGVTVKNEVDFEITNGDTPVKHFEIGDIKLNGEEALQFVRERYSFIDGDYQRARNQQIFLEAVFREILSANTLANPGRIQQVVAAISPHVTTDSGITSDYLLSLAFSLRSMNANGIVSFTVPTAGIGTSDDGQSIVELDEERLETLANAFETDTLSEYVANNDLNTY